MMKSKNISITRGDDVVKSFKLQGDWTSKTAYFTIKNDRKLNSVRYVDLSTNNGITSTFDGQLTKFEISIPKENLQATTTSSLVWDLVFDDDTTPLTGGVELLHDVRTPYDGLPVDENLLWYILLDTTDFDDKTMLLFTKENGLIPFSIDELSEMLGVNNDSDILDLYNLEGLTSTYGWKEEDIRIEGKVDNLESDVTTNTANISDNTTSIATNTANISNNTTDISNNTTDISNNTTDISNNTTDISNNTTNISNNTTDISNNTTDISNNTTNIATNTTNISNNATDITTLEGDSHQQNTDTQFNNGVSEVGIKELLDNAVYSNKWQPKGEAILNGTSQYYSHPTNPNLNQGNGDFSIEWYGRINLESRYQALIDKKGFGALGSFGWGLAIIPSNALRLQIQSDTSIKQALQSSVLTDYDGKYTHIIATVSNSTNKMTFYINGVLFASATITTYTSVDNANIFTIGNYQGTIWYQNTNVIFARLYNKELTLSDATARWNNGRPEEFVEPFETSGANQTDLTSGSLEIGKQYIIDTFVAGDDFTNVGASSNASSEVFTATGTTPTTWTNASTLKTQGNVFEVKSKDFGTNGAKCLIGNELSVLNATDNPIAPNQVFDGRQGVTNAEVLLANSHPKNAILEGIYVTEMAGQATSFDISTSAGSGGDIASAVAIGANETVFVHVNELSLTARDIYCNGDTAGDDLNFYLKYKYI